MRSAASFGSPACYLIKRIYAESSPRDGVRVLVDRLWPRGLTRAAASVDEWAKDLAPTTALRKWYGHDPGRWAEFRRRYLAELKTQDAAVRCLLERAHGKPLTLLYASRDPRFNHAVVLKEVLRRGSRPRRTGGRSVRTEVAAAGVRPRR